jgi:hypothetical protein
MSDQSTPASVVFKEVSGFPGYRVGDDGSVWSRWRRGGRTHGYILSDVWRLLVGGIDRDGYHKLILCAGGKRRHVRAAILVLEAFVGPCPAGMESCHEDGDNTNDRLSNLRWDTHLNNIRDKRRHGTHQTGEKHAFHKFTDDQVREIRARRAAGEKVTHLAREFKVWPGTISAITTGRHWKHLLPEPAEPGLFDALEDA